MTENTTGTEPIESAAETSPEAESAWDTVREAIEVEAPASTGAGDAQPEAEHELDPPQLGEEDFGVLEDLRAQLFGDGDEDKGAANAATPAASAAPNASKPASPAAAAEPAKPARWDAQQIDAAATLRALGYDIDTEDAAPIKSLIDHTNKQSQYIASLEQKLDGLQSGLTEFQQHRQALETARTQAIERGIHSEIDKLAKANPFFAKVYGTSDKLTPEAMKEREALLKGVSKLPGVTLDTAASKIAHVAKIRHGVQANKAATPVQRSTPPRGGNAKPLTGFAAVEAKLGFKR
jgi:hypothetical protein